MIQELNTSGVVSKLSFTEYQDLSQMTSVSRIEKTLGDEDMDE
jgi:hypothetical protein